MLKQISCRQFMVTSRVILLNLQYYLDKEDRYNVTLINSLEGTHGFAMVVAPLHPCTLTCYLFISFLFITFLSKTKPLTSFHQTKDIPRAHKMPKHNDINRNFDVICLTWNNLLSELNFENLLTALPSSFRFSAFKLVLGETTTKWFILRIWKQLFRVMYMLCPNRIAKLD